MCWVCVIITIAVISLLLVVLLLPLLLLVSLLPNTRWYLRSWSSYMNCLMLFADILLNICYHYHTLL